MIANKNAKEKLSLGLWVTKIKTDTAVSGVLTIVIYPRKQILFLDTLHQTLA